MSRDPLWSLNVQQVVDFGKTVSSPQRFPSLKSLHDNTTNELCPLQYTGEAATVVSGCMLGLAVKWVLLHKVAFGQVGSFGH